MIEKVIRSKTFKITIKCLKNLQLLWAIDQSESRGPAQIVGHWCHLEAGDCQAFARCAGQDQVWISIRFRNKNTYIYALIFKCVYISIWYEFFLIMNLSITAVNITGAPFRHCTNQPCMHHKWKCRVSTKNAKSFHWTIILAILIEIIAHFYRKKTKMFFCSKTEKVCGILSFSNWSTKVQKSNSLQREKNSFDANSRWSLSARWDNKVAGKLVSRWQVYAAKAGTLLTVCVVGAAGRNQGGWWEKKRGGALSSGPE